MSMAGNDGGALGKIGGRIIKCIVCKQQISGCNVSPPGESGSSSCSSIDKSLTRAFLQSMEANLEALEGLIEIPFCRRCRDKAVLLPGTLANYQVAYKLFEDVRKDLAYTAIEAAGDPEEMEKEDDEGSYQNQKEVISSAQDVRKAIIKKWMPKYLDERSKLQNGCDEKP